MSICNKNTIPKLYHALDPWTLILITMRALPWGYFSSNCIIWGPLHWSCNDMYSNKLLKTDVCKYECSHTYLWPRLGQDCGAHALGGAHAKVEALGGCEGLSWPHQVKQVCWSRAGTWSWNRGERRGGGSGRSCSHHGSKKVSSTGVNSLSRYRHLTSGEGVPLSKVSIAAGGRHCHNKK